MTNKLSFLFAFIISSFLCLMFADNLCAVINSWDERTTNQSVLSIAFSLVFLLIAGAFMVRQFRLLTLTRTSLVIYIMGAHASLAAASLRITHLSSYGYNPIEAFSLCVIFYMAILAAFMFLKDTKIKRVIILSLYVIFPFLSFELMNLIRHI